jgi:hypothetical protein
MVIAGILVVNGILIYALAFTVQKINRMQSSKMAGEA